MERNGWYLIAYDIADNKRLAKVHRLMKKEGIAAQKSLFFMYGKRSKVTVFLDQLESMIKANKDDIRAYPIVSAKEIWTNNSNPVATFPFIGFGYSEKSKTVKKSLTCFDKFHRRLHAWFNRCP